LSSNSGLVSELDVRHAYMLFLGRPADAGAFVGKIGMPLDELAHEMITSIEFRESVVRPSVSNGGVVRGRYLSPPEASFIEWFLSGRLLPAECAKSINNKSSWGDLISVVIENACDIDTLRPFSEDFELNQFQVLLSKHSIRSNLGPFSGAIESFLNGRLKGWIRPLVALAAVELEVLSGDTVLGRDHCANAGDDLIGSAVGADGRGFEITVVQTALYADPPARIVIKHAGKRYEIGNVVDYVFPDRKSLHICDDATPRIYFDITDLVIFLRNYNTVSGIQRVQCGYIVNAIKFHLSKSPVSLCFQSAERGALFVIPDDISDDVVEVISAEKSCEDWSSILEIIQNRSIFAQKLSSKDIIVTLGAPWVHEAYFDLLRVMWRMNSFRYIQIFYDLIPTLAPEYVGAGLIGGFNYAIAGMLSYCSQIISISKYSAADLSNTALELNAPMPQIAVVPMGETIRYIDNTVDLGDLTEIRKSDIILASKKSIGGKKLRNRSVSQVFKTKFILCVGTIEPRKNHILLFHVWKKLAARMGDQTPKLVLVGRFGWHMEDFKRVLEVTDYLDKKIVILDGVADEDLEELYRNCLFTIFPSLYEGWGLPVTESLYYGKLCVTSSTSSTPEAGREWAEYIDPYCITSAYEKILSLLESDGEVAKRERAIRETYTPMSWRAATEALIASIEGGAAGVDQDVKRVNILTPGVCYRFGSTGVDGTPKARLGADLHLHRALSALSGPGWHRHEWWGIWSSSDVATLSFIVEGVRSEPVEIYLNWRLPDIYGVQIVEININGEVSHEKLVSGPAKIVCLEPAMVRSDGVIDITMSLNVSEPFHGSQHDRRCLGIGLLSIMVCKAGDNKAKLGYLDQILPVFHAPV
jgi:glycosyltransferase involved in cell wall biosynthesis